MLISINGKLFEENDAKISVLDHGLLLGDGLFETLRTFDGRLFKFDEHYNRLKDSAKQILMEVPIDRATLKRDVEKVIKANNLTEARVRITVTRGVGPSGLSVDCNGQSIIIVVEELKSADFEKGVKVITYNLERNIPDIKSLSYLPSVIAKAKAEKKKAFEAILIDNKGFVREGSFSNVFIVKDKELSTPKDKVLKGITRETIIEIARENGIPVDEAEISKKDLFDADEVFITFTTGGIVPVVMVDDADKNVGGSIKKLIILYKEYVKNV